MRIKANLLISVGGIPTFLFLYELLNDAVKTNNDWNVGIALCVSVFFSLLIVIDQLMNKLESRQYITVVMVLFSEHTVLFFFIVFL